LDILEDIQLTDKELVADKGYLSAGRQASLFEEYRVKLVMPLRRNMDLGKSQWEQVLPTQMKKSRNLALATA